MHRELAPPAAPSAAEIELAKLKQEMAAMKLKQEQEQQAAAMPDWASVHRQLFAAQCLKLPDDLNLLMKEKTEGKARLFVSHCTRDDSILVKQNVQAVAQFLGKEVFNPDEFFKTTEASKAEMAKQAGEHDVTIASMSPLFFKSPWCFAEIQGAVQTGKPIIAVYWGETFPKALMKKWVAANYAAES